ncbi:hypothetical protein Pf1_00440 [Flavobacterium columnare]|nr:hypothetical protein Pf1_00440 [Flavobacterium columnare]
MVLDALRARTNDDFQLYTQPSVRAVFKMKKKRIENFTFNPVYFKFK